MLKGKLRWLVLLKNHLFPHFLGAKGLFLLSQVCPSVLLGQYFVISAANPPEFLGTSGGELLHFVLPHPRALFCSCPWVPVLISLGILPSPLALKDTQRTVPWAVLPLDPFLH